MTDIEKRAREMMAEDSGGVDLAWEDSPESERESYMMYAVAERARTYQLARAMVNYGEASDVVVMSAVQMVTDALRRTGLSIVNA